MFSMDSSFNSSAGSLDFLFRECVEMNMMPIQIIQKDVKGNIIRKSLSFKKWRTIANTALKGDTDIDEKGFWYDKETDMLFNIYENSPVWLDQPHRVEKERRRIYGYLNESVPTQKFNKDTQMYEMGLTVADFGGYDVEIVKCYSWKPFKISVLK